VREGEKTNLGEGRDNFGEQLSRAYAEAIEEELDQGQLPEGASPVGINSIEISMHTCPR